MREVYRNQVRLLLKVLPLLSKTKVFALKGGTAINFFVRDFPRFSIDIDLTYLPVKNRTGSLQDIAKGVSQVKNEIEKHLPNISVNTQKSGGILSKLLIKLDKAQIKLEVNTVLRGSIYDSVEMELSPSLQSEFNLYIAVQTLSFQDLYGGKLCAALDRQHPRDLYDVRLLLNNEGLTEEVRRAFIGYLISHSRPMNELLNPNIIPIDEIYHNEFEGMTKEVDILDELKDIQKKLPGMILNDLTNDEKEFLLSIKKGAPNWQLIPLPVLKNLPGVQWKLLNLSKMDEKKHKEAVEKLEKVLMK